METIDISFVIPCYCSEHTLENVVNEINKIMARREGISFEIVMVNDCSKDNTEGVIDFITSKYENCKGIHFSKNFGQPAALMAGFSYAKGNYIMTCDDDGQSPIDRLWDFYDTINSGYDIVCAKYIDRTNRSKFRQLGTKGNEYMLERYIKKPKHLYLSSFFMARRNIIKEITKYTNPYPYLAGLILRSTSRIANIEVEQRKRQVGNSGYNFKKLIKLWFNGITTFSVRPLRISFVIGIIALLFSALLMITCIALSIAKVNFNLTIMVLSLLLFFFTGIIMLSLGLIGEYIGRSYMSINVAPQYVIYKVSGEK